jgi:hypothetical protein
MSTPEPPSGVDSSEIDAMFHPDQYQPTSLPIVAPPPAAPVTRGCLQDGCPCRDVRIVSHRKAAFFAAMARRAGETADRVITPDPAWTLPQGDLA